MQAGASSDLNSFPVQTFISVFSALITDTLTLAVDRKVSIHIPHPDCLASSGNQIDAPHGRKLAFCNLQAIHKSNKAIEFMTLI